MTKMARRSPAEIFVFVDLIIRETDSDTLSNDVLATIYMVHVNIYGCNEYLVIFTYTYFYRTFHLQISPKCDQYSRDSRVSSAAMEFQNASYNA